MKINGSIALGLTLLALGFDRAGSNLGKAIDAATGRLLTPVVAHGSGVATVGMSAYYANFVVFIANNVILG